MPPGGSCCPERDRLNRAIRRLMDQPASRERSQKWAALLAQWADACTNSGDCWTTAA
jgi:hypothetical protein